MFNLKKTLGYAQTPVVFVLLGLAFLFFPYGSSSVASGILGTLAALCVILALLSVGLQLRKRR